MEGRKERDRWDGATKVTGKFGEPLNDTNLYFHFLFANKPRVMRHKGKKNQIAYRQITYQTVLSALQGAFRDENITKSFYNQHSQNKFALSRAGDITQPFLISEVTTSSLENSAVSTNAQRNYFQWSDTIKWKTYMIMSMWWNLLTSALSVTV